MNRLYWKLARSLDIALHEARALVREALYFVGAVCALAAICLIMLGA